MHYISHNKPGESKINAKTLIKEIEKNKAGSGWEGDSVEREWADVMNYFVIEKINKKSKQGFERYDINWLLVYDNWTLPMLDHEIAAQILLPILVGNVSFNEFDNIFIMSGKYFIDFSSSGSTFHDVNDLWN